MSTNSKKPMVGKITVKASLANKTKSVGSPESIPATTATDPIPRSSEYMEDAKALMAALWAVEGGEADVADRRGELVHPIIMKLRDGHYGKWRTGPIHSGNWLTSLDVQYQLNRFGGFSIVGISQ